MVMQDPKFSLNPVMRVGDQIVEAYRQQTGAGRAAARQRAMEMLDAVRIRDPERVFVAYPHEVSGGMGQRIMIAMMLASGPEILIADEPTSALDVSVRTEVLRIMDDLVRDRGMGLIFISHDLNLVAQFCDRVLIMYAGRVVEELPARDLHAARHPYTQGLLNSLPRLDAPVERLEVLERRGEWARVRLQAEAEQQRLQDARDAQRAYDQDPGHLFLVTLEHTYLVRDTGHTGPAGTCAFPRNSPVTYGAGR